jgi:predicted ABC-type ATPase
MREAKAAGYFIRFFYIGTNSPAINAARVAQRIMEGGHNVPIPKIIERYPRSIANCVIGCKIADRGYVYDNSGLPDEEKLLFRTTDGVRIKLYETDLSAYEWVGSVLAELNDPSE